MKDPKEYLQFEKLKEHMIITVYNPEDLSDIHFDPNTTYLSKTADFLNDVGFDNFRVHLAFPDFIGCKDDLAWDGKLFSTDFSSFFTMLSRAEILLEELLTEIENSKLVKIYRVEDLDGDGPYRGDFVEMLSHHNDDSINHPNVYEDSQLLTNLRLTEDMFFGFRSFEQLSKWFDKSDINALIDAGFVISEYEISDRFVNSSDFQAVFIKKHARITNQFNLDFDQDWKSFDGVIKELKYKPKI